MWEFTKIDRMEDMKFDPLLDKFYNLGVSALVRENIQNAMDAKLHSDDTPVELEIKIGDVRTDQIPGIDEVLDRIKVLHGGNNYTNNAINHMNQCTNVDVVKYISFEDKNTKGLSGAIHGNNPGKNDTWGIYAYQKGVHYEEEDESKESLRGGSHGVGKIASNSASDINLMFFANCDEFGNKHLGGTVQLIEHKYNDNYYRSTGYFTRCNDNGGFYPYANKNSGIFEKNTRGMKIVIPFLRSQFSNITEIYRSVCDSFFIAILEKKLVVKINGYAINSETILNIVRDESIYPEQNIEDINNNFTSLYIHSYKSINPIDLTVIDLKKTHKFKLFFQYDENIRKGRLAVVRRIGMKIADIKIPSHAKSPFNAVLIPMGDSEDVFLKSLENESHTEIGSDQIKDPQYQKNAKRFLSNLNREIAAIISNKIKEENPTDGLIDTNDLIYTVENKFKKSLTESISTVKINKGKKQSSKVLIKLETKKDSKTTGRKNKKLDEITPKKPKVNNGENEKEINTFVMKPDLVKRALLFNQEKLVFDFKDNPSYDGETKCNIFLRIVDGTGKEQKNEFDIGSNYRSIFDENSGNVCQVHQESILGVSILDDKIALKLILNDTYNHALKFNYIVEVY